MEQCTWGAVACERGVVVGARKARTICRLGRCSGQLAVRCAGRGFLCEVCTCAEVRRRYGSGGVTRTDCTLGAAGVARCRESVLNAARWKVTRVTMRVTDAGDRGEWRGRRASVGKNWGWAR